MDQSVVDCGDAWDGFSSVPLVRQKVKLFVLQIKVFDDKNAFQKEYCSESNHPRFLSQSQERQAHDERVSIFQSVDQSQGGANLTLLTS